MTAEVRSAASTGESPPSVVDGVVTAGQGQPRSDGAAVDHRAGGADPVVAPDADGAVPNGAVPNGAVPNGVLPDAARPTGALAEDAVPGKARRNRDGHPATGSYTAADTSGDTGGDGTGSGDGVGPPAEHAVPKAAEPAGVGTGSGDGVVRRTGSRAADQAAGDAGSRAAGRAAKPAADRAADREAADAGSRTARRAADRAADRADTRAAAADGASPRVDGHAADGAAPRLDGHAGADGLAGVHLAAVAGKSAAEHDPLQDEVEATVAKRLGAVLDDDMEADPAEFAAAAVLDVLRAAGWADASEAAELRAESERLRELLNMVVRDHRAREASAAGMGDQQLQWLVPLLRSAHGVAFGSLGAKVALRTAVQDVPPDVLAKAGLRIDYGVEPAGPDLDQPAGY